MRGSERGVALLLVLAAVAVVATGTVGLARLAGTTALQREVGADEALVLDLLYAIDAPIQDWLTTRAPGIVLPPDAPVPHVSVLRWEGLVGERRVALRLDAFDECGRVSVAALREGSPLRLLVPTELRTVVGSAVVSPSVGLDEFAEALQDRALRAFPSAEREEGATSRTLGAWVSTHGNTFNVHTCPRPLLMAAYRALGSEEAEDALAARAEGKRVSSVPSSPENDAAVVLRTDSTAWAFRAEAQVGRVTRDAWLVYTRTGEGWSCAQRLVIHE